MAFLLKAAKPVIRMSTKSQLFSPVSFTRFEKTSSAFSPMKKTFSSLAEKTYEDLFAWVAADVHAYSRYTSLLARLCTSRSKLESQLPSESKNSDKSQSAGNYVLRMLENFSDKDLMNLILCTSLYNPEVSKVFFVGGANSTESITKTMLQISFPKMRNTIADECNKEWEYKYSRFRFKSEPGSFDTFVNVPDIEKDSLAVFIHEDLLMVTGKLTIPSIYDEIMKESDKAAIRQLYKIFNLKPPTSEFILATSRLPYKEYDLKQATGEIMEEDELRISYPVVLEEVTRPRYMKVKLKQIHDCLN